MCKLGHIGASMISNWTSQRYYYLRGTGTWPTSETHSAFLLSRETLVLFLCLLMARYYLRSSTLVRLAVFHNHATPSLLYHSP